MFRLFLRLMTDRHRPAKPRRDEAGFTLVELMVVIVIIGLLATVVLINVMPSQDKAMQTKARTDIATLEQAMEMYRLDNFTYPTDLNALVQPPVGSDSTRYRSGGYVKRLPSDPWNRPYQLTVPGRGGPFDIVSLGADGAAGGSDENADIGADG